VAGCGGDQCRAGVPGGCPGREGVGSAAGGRERRAGREAVCRRFLGLEASTFSGHSLRSGFLTSAAESGANVFKMAEVSRHRSLDTLRGYVRRVDLFKEHARAAFL